MQISSPNKCDIIFLYSIAFLRDTTRDGVSSCSPWSLCTDDERSLEDKLASSIEAHASERGSDPRRASQHARQPARKRGAVGGCTWRASVAASGARGARAWRHRRERDRARRPRRRVRTGLVAERGRSGRVGRASSRRGHPARERGGRRGRACGSRTRA